MCDEEKISASGAVYGAGLFPVRGKGLRARGVGQRSGCKGIRRLRGLRLMDDLCKRRSRHRGPGRDHRLLGRLQRLLQHGDFRPRSRISQPGHHQYPLQRLCRLREPQQRDAPGNPAENRRLCLFRLRRAGVDHAPGRRDRDELGCLQRFRRPRVRGDRERHSPNAQRQRVLFLHSWERERQAAVHLLR